MKESEKRAKGTDPEVPEAEEVVIAWGVSGGTEAEHKSELLRLKRYLYGEIVEAGCGIGSRTALLLAFKLVAIHRHESSPPDRKGRCKLPGELKSWPKRQGISRN